MFLQGQHDVDDVPAKQLGATLCLGGEAGQHAKNLDVRLSRLFLNHVNELLRDTLLQELNKAIVWHVAISSMPYHGQVLYFDDIKSFRKDAQICNYAERLLSIL